MYSVSNCHNVAKQTEFYLGQLRFNVISTCNAGCLAAFDCRRYQIFSEVVGLERGSLSLLSTTEELKEK
jgi:hypothetical protein